MNKLNKVEINNRIVDIDGKKKKIISLNKISKIIRKNNKIEIEKHYDKTLLTKTYKAISTFGFFDEDLKVFLVEKNNWIGE